VQQGISTDVQHLLDKYLIISLNGNCTGILPSALFRSYALIRLMREFVSFLFILLLYLLHFIILSFLYMFMYLVNLRTDLFGSTEVLHANFFFNVL